MATGNMDSRAPAHDAIAQNGHESAQNRHAPVPPPSSHATLQCLSSLRRTLPRHRPPPEHRPRKTLTPRQAPLLSLAAALSTIAMKTGAWWLTGSIGLDTLLSVGASLINLLVARVLLQVGRAHRSLALEADARLLSAAPADPRACA